MEEMTIFEIMIITLFGLFCFVFIFISFWSLFQQQGPTYKEMMDWDFRGCEQMRESGYPEEEIAELMRRPGNYYDKDYE